MPLGLEDQWWHVAPVIPGCQGKTNAAALMIHSAIKINGKAGTCCSVYPGTKGSRSSQHAVTV